MWKFKNLSQPDGVTSRQGDRSMRSVAVEEALSRLGEIIDDLKPGEEVILTRGGNPVARIVAWPAEKPRPLPGRGKGMLTVISEDGDHLKDFVEHMP
jgi:antitoxin (DNA-binding transcriptional repressor) of toxin-antitoxin stability system